MSESRERFTFVKVEGVVWCDGHGNVHEDVLDPYDYGADALEDWCSPDDHAPVYVLKEEEE